MPSVVAIAQDPTAIQLALTGAHVVEVRDSGEAQDAINQWLGDDVELLIISEGLREGFSETFVERLRRHKGRPLVVYCPLFETESAEVDAYLSSVLKPAVGYEIRLD